MEKLHIPQTNGCTIQSLTPDPIHFVTKKGDSLQETSLKNMGQRLVYKGELLSSQIYPYDSAQDMKTMKHKGAYQACSQNLSLSFPAFYWCINVSS